jgi:phosphocarrier protein
MKSQKTTLRCKEGLHLRVASQVAKIAQKSGGIVKIRCKKDSAFANACSVLELLTLGATLGSPIEIIAEGPDEDTVLAALVNVFQQPGLPEK